jgi:hypothetical protein
MHVTYRGGSVPAQTSTAKLRHPSRTCRKSQASVTRLTDSRQACKHNATEAAFAGGMLLGSEVRNLQLKRP